ncbi:hypothetical protein Ahy_B01g055836 [Arachis hypogaea]|uniref:ABC transporter domain-containing protein n=1 Tax=Arachis hypogaea TaxID=3818 RepID=A0A445AXC0_ARAHY|nr:hypothetical protein Ahy_B01g055836 [Arachis hypogaea]
MIRTEGKTGKFENRRWIVEPVGNRLIEPNRDPTVSSLHNVKQQSRVQTLAPIRLNLIEAAGACPSSHRRRPNFELRRQRRNPPPFDLRKSNPLSPVSPLASVAQSLSAGASSVPHHHVGHYLPSHFHTLASSALYHWSHSHTTLAKLSAKRQEVLSPAGNIVERTIVQIRVVLGCWHLLGRIEHCKVTHLHWGLLSSGSEKSMVVSLIERFYQKLYVRQVLLDGNDVKSLKLKWLRQQIGLVSQELALFAITIRENMLLERSDADQVEIEEATRVANAHSFIIKLPEGYETQIYFCSFYFLSIQLEVIHNNCVPFDCCC